MEAHMIEIQQHEKIQQSAKLEAEEMAANQALDIAEAAMNRMLESEQLVQRPSFKRFGTASE
jgi:hypothetical protein